MACCCCSGYDLCPFQKTINARHILGISSLTLLVCPAERMGGWCNCWAHSTWLRSQVLRQAAHRPARHQARRRQALSKPLTVCGSQAAPASLLTAARAGLRLEAPASALPAPTLPPPPPPALAARLAKEAGSGRPGAAAERLARLARLREAAAPLLASSAGAGSGPGSLSGQQGSQASALVPLLDTGEGVVSRPKPLAAVSGAAAAAAPLAAQTARRGVHEDVPVGRQQAPAMPARRGAEGPAAAAPAGVRGAVFRAGRPDAARRAIADRLNRLSALQAAGEQLMAGR